MNKSFVATLIAVFILLSSGIYLLEAYYPAFHIKALLIGNLIMYLLSLGSYLIIKKQMAGRPQAFVRGVMGASFLKLMVCMAAILVYVFISRLNIHKPTVFMLMGIYAVYAVTETLMLSKMVRQGAR